MDGPYFASQIDSAWVVMLLHAAIISETELKYRDDHIYVRADVKA